MADRSRSGRTAALVMGFLFLLLGLGGAIAAWGAYATDTRIARTGVRAEGQLLGKSISAAADGTSGHILEYRFTTADGRTVDASRTVDEELWRSFEEGDAIVISYAPENPGRSFPVGGGVTSIPVVLVVSGLSILFAMFGGALLRGWALQRRVGTT